eukprot:TRINITY_DN127_c0_g2_i1.p1 TRINITY_DN127_c0_g2~~TRINITY_DN127_c0_g2_i1.p1  ORF type:complete len:141 (+),score=31.08 TRINITY_DN127_c0_g2_i1:438-860(+)
MQPSDKGDRRPLRTLTYRRAVLSVAKELNVPTIDLWGEIVSRLAESEVNKTGLSLSEFLSEEAAGGIKKKPDGKKLSDYLLDGLHLNRMGNLLLYDCIISKIAAEKWTHLLAPEMKPDVPLWDTVPRNPPPSFFTFHKLK